MSSYSYDDFGDDEDFGLGDGVGALLARPCFRSLLPMRSTMSPINLCQLTRQHTMAGQQHELCMEWVRN